MPSRCRSICRPGGCCLPARRCRMAGCRAIAPAPSSMSHGRPMNDEAIRDLATPRRHRRRVARLSPGGRRSSRPTCCATCWRRSACPAATRGDLLASRRLLQRRSTVQALPPLITATAGRPTRLDVGASEPRDARLSLEDGRHATIVQLSPVRGRLRVPAVSETGYHRLLIDDREFVLAVAPTPLPHDRGCGAGCAAVGHRGAGLFAASPRRRRHRRRCRHRRTGRGGGVARRGCAGAEPAARAVRRRSVALRALFAVDAPVPQSAARIAGAGVRRGACGRHAARRRAGRDVRRGWRRCR